MTASVERERSATRPFGLLVTIFLVAELTPIFETTMMSTALPTLMTAFDADTATISWVITIFLLVGAGTAAIAGRLGDSYGRKRVLIVLMAISALGSIVSIVAGNLTGVLIGRALQGTSAGLFPLLIGLAREVAPPRRVSLLSSLTSGVSVVGGAFGAVLAGVLLEASGWHSMFVASAALSIVAIAFAIFLPRPVTTARGLAGIDVVGAIVMAPALAAILFGVTTARATGVTPAVVAFVAGGLVLFAFWIFWELRISQPMFNLRLFRQPSLVLALAATAFVSLGIMAGPALLTPILQQSPTTLPVGLGLTPTQAGLFFLVGGLLSFALSPVAGRVAGRFGARVVLLAGFVVGIVGYAGFLVCVHDLVLSTAAILLGSVGTALIVVAVPLVIVEIVPPEDTSEAVALIYTVGRTIFSAVGTAIVGILLTSSTVPDTTAPTLTAWYLGVGFVLATGVLGLIVTLAIRKAVPLDRREQAVATTE
ncbi:MAG: MFS transporter [Microbacterium sp.]